MKNKLKEILSITRNERIGLLCLIVLIGIILLARVLCSDNGSKPLPVSNKNFTELSILEIDSVRIDTIKKKKRKKKKTDTSPKEILTISSMKEVETFE